MKFFDRVSIGHPAAAAGASDDQMEKMVEQNRQDAVGPAFAMGLLEY